MNEFEQTKLLAEQGDASAQFNLALMYANGKGVKQNDAEAVKWYTKAAEQGHADAKIWLDRLTPPAQKNSTLLTNHA